MKKGLCVLWSRYLEEMSLYHNSEMYGGPGGHFSLQWSQVSSDLPQDLPEVSSDLPQVSSDLPQVSSDLAQVSTVKPLNKGPPKSNVTPNSNGTGWTGSLFPLAQYIGNPPRATPPTSEQQRLVTPQLKIYIKKNLQTTTCM